MTVIGGNDWVTVLGSVPHEVLQRLTRYWAFPHCRPAKYGGVGMFSGGDSRAVNYRTKAWALAFVAAHPSIGMELTPIKATETRGALHLTIEALVNRLPTTMPLPWKSIGQIGSPRQAKTKQSERFPKNCVAGKPKKILLMHMQRDAAQRIDKKIAEIKEQILFQRTTSEQGDQFIGAERQFLTQARGSAPL